jgi:hypothetical protein
LPNLQDPWSVVGTGGERVRVIPRIAQGIKKRWTLICNCIFTFYYSKSILHVGLLKHLLTLQEREMMIDQSDAQVVLHKMN